MSDSGEVGAVRRTRNLGARDASLQKGSASARKIGQENNSRNTQSNTDYIPPPSRVLGPFESLINQPVSSVAALDPVDFELRKFVGLVVKSNPNSPKFTQEFVDELTDLTSSYMSHLVALLHKYTEVQRHRRAGVADLQMCLSNNDITLSELYGEYERTKRQQREVKQYAALLEQRLMSVLSEYNAEKYTLDKDDPSLVFHANEQYEIAALVPRQSAPRAYIPSYFPDLPPDFTYQATGSYLASLTDLKQIKLKLVEEARLNEKSLYSLIEDDAAMLAALERDVDASDVDSEKEDIMSMSGDGNVTEEGGSPLEEKGGFDEGGNASEVDKMSEVEEAEKPGVGEKEEENEEKEENQEKEEPKETEEKEEIKEIEKPELEEKAVEIEESEEGATADKEDVPTADETKDEHVTASDKTKSDAQAATAAQSDTGKVQDDTSLEAEGSEEKAAAEEPERTESDHAEEVTAHSPSAFSSNKETGARGPMLFDFVEYARKRRRAQQRELQQIETRRRKRRSNIFMRAEHVFSAYASAPPTMEDVAYFDSVLEKGFRQVVQATRTAERNKREKLARLLREKAEREHEIEQQNGAFEFGFSFNPASLLDSDDDNEEPLDIVFDEPEAQQNGENEKDAAEEHNTGDAESMDVDEENTNIAPVQANGAVAEHARADSDGDSDLAENLDAALAGMENESEESEELEDM